MVLLFLADGFEEIEGLTVVDILRRAQIATDMVSIMGRKEIRGAHDIMVQADMLFEEVEQDGYDMLILPGGGIGTQNLAACEELKQLVSEYVAKDRYVAAICAAPTVFGKMGILQGKKACCYQGMEDGLVGAEVCFEPVVQDGKIVTSRGMGTSIAFALKLTEIFLGSDAAKDMAAKIMY